ncbi:MAG: hypothetical protein KAQ85_06180, partial [Thermodesulfovibrionia bacterium]|nr:hypothetical protein [Thermodesulfovibrionia bacterium]
MHEDIVVKVNKTVAKGTPLTESNFTKDGDIALGINARVGYMAYHGDNTNDAVVISESAAKKLTSQHMYKKLIEEDAEIKTGKKFWLTQFPNKHTMTQLGNIDGEGLPVKGSRVNYGDPIILATRKASLTANDIMLGKLNTDFRTKFRDAAVTWDKEHPGVITDVVKTGKRVQVTVKMDAPMLVGDKLSNKYGNKSVVSKIVPDDQMIKDESGNTVDILMAPTGVVSRINPGQLLENALGKVAEKTGKKIVVTNFDPQDRIKTVKKILKKHGISEMETVFDPMTGKKIKNINVGKQQIMKLFKSTDTNFGSRGLGTYDINQQPVRGGSSGSKRIGGMELNALLAHGATSVISESSRLKSQKNDEWWNAYKLGLPL